MATGRCVLLVAFFHKAQRVGRQRLILSNAGGYENAGDKDPISEFDITVVSTTSNFANVSLDLTLVTARLERVIKHRDVGETDGNIHNRQAANIY